MIVVESTKPEEKGKITRWTVTDDEGRKGEIVYTFATERLIASAGDALALDVVGSPDFGTARDRLLAMLATLPIPEPEPTPALVALLAQEPEQSSESDETEVVSEPVPAPRGRVVARWVRLPDGSASLTAGAFTVELLGSHTGKWVSRVWLGQRFLHAECGDPLSVIRAAVEYIRSLIAPFGGELVVEGEP